MCLLRILSGSVCYRGIKNKHYDSEYVSQEVGFIYVRVDNFWRFFVSCIISI